MRAILLASFILTVAITVWALFAHHHLLHMIHMALATFTFMLIALYLHKSAAIASLVAYRELHLRLTVDPCFQFILSVPTGTPVFNACAGALARSGIYVKGPAAMLSLSKLETVAAIGNSESRAGYSITKATLAKMNIRLSDDPRACPVQILLGSFQPESDIQFDFVLTQNKITHLLKAVYISRLYMRFRRLTIVLLIGSLAVATALIALGFLTYAGASIAVLGGSEVMIIHEIEKKTSRLSFSSVLQ